MVVGHGCERRIYANQQYLPSIEFPLHDGALQAFRILIWINNKAELRMNHQYAELICKSWGELTHVQRMIRVAVNNRLSEANEVDHAKHLWYCGLYLELQVHHAIEFGVYTVYCGVTISVVP